MDATNRLPLREREDVDVVFKVFIVIAKTLPAKAGFIEAEGVDHRAHRAIENEDSLGEQITEQVATI